MRVLVGALFVVGCGAKPQRSDVVNQADPAKPKVTKPTYVATAERPDIDVARWLPDFHDELRWPLGGMAHPKLEPGFSIATALAAPGVSWLDLCTMGAQNRHTSGDRELVAYLRGWCSAVNGDVDNACRHLTPLLGAPTRVGAVVRADLANILVEQGDADKAEHWLNKHKIRDLGTLDLLAANFVEVGQLNDAMAINRRALDADLRATAATTCRRLTKHIVLGNAHEPGPIEKLEELATKSKVPDAVCEQLHHKVQCWMSPGEKCDAYVQDQQLDPKTATLLAVYYAWPTKDASTGTWMVLGNRAVEAIPVDGAAELAVTALQTSLRANHNGCYDVLSTSIFQLVEAFGQHPKDAVQADRAKALLEHCRHDRREERLRSGQR